MVLFRAPEWLALSSNGTAPVSLASFPLPTWRGDAEVAGGGHQRGWRRPKEEGASHAGAAPHLSPLFLRT
uniref:Uncharacterized protein n=1 Tax=Oryza barthii TaxID=65489 RepID=A0A0D3GLS7_9ORYZ